MRKTIAIDVDGVVVDCGDLWYRWLQDRFEINFDDVWAWYYKHNINLLPYDLTKLFVIPEGVDAYAFWKDSRLYDSLKPLKDSQKYIEKLSDLGYNIVFVSRISGEHSESKFNFIKRNFKFDGVIFTREKHFVRCDYFIDDSIANISKQPEDVICIQYRTKYLEEGVTANRSYWGADSWKGVFSIITLKTE